MAQRVPTQAMLRENFQYMPYGAFVSKKTGNEVGAYDRVRKCMRLRIGTTTYPLAKLIYCYHHGIYPNKIQHIDGDTKNNTISNLSVVPGAPRTGGRAPASGIKGLQQLQEADGSITYKVAVYFKGKMHYGGTYAETEKDKAIQRMEEMRYRLQVLHFRKVNKQPWALKDLDDTLLSARPGEVIYVQGDDYNLYALNVPRNQIQIRNNVPETDPKLNTRIKLDDTATDMEHTHTDNNQTQPDYEDDDGWDDIATKGDYEEDE